MKQKSPIWEHEIAWSGTNFFIKILFSSTYLHVSCKNQVTWTRGQVESLLKLTHFTLLSPINFLSINLIDKCLLMSWSVVSTCRRSLKSRLSKDVPEWLMQVFLSIVENHCLAGHCRGSSMLLPILLPHGTNLIAPTAR